jgi:light-regulated signal transduction histidine kinase (bacteriophytochrome)
MNELEQRLEAQFQARISRLEEANRELLKFSYRAAHDLQQELRTITTFMSLAEESRPNVSDPNFEKYLAVSKEGAARMQALVRDILAYVRAGSEPPNLAPASLSIALRWARYALAANLKEMNAEIEEGSLGDADIDVGEIGIVFQNLLTNAIKFRKTGERPRIRIAGSKTDGDEWVVSVHDEGIGFDPQYSRKIFEPFERLHGANKYPGTGIGLAICKKLVQAHGGRIWAEGRPGEGATFYFTVAAAPTDSSTASKGSL